MKTISATDLKGKLNSGDIELVDVLSEESYNKIHIPGSKNIPLDQIEKKAEEELPDKNAKIVVYCASDSCMASPKAAKKLESMGYQNIIDFEDGLEGWKNAGFEFESGSQKSQEA